jgi:hypothetical protein
MQGFALLLVTYVTVKFPIQSIIGGDLNLPQVDWKGVAEGMSGTQAISFMRVSKIQGGEVGR